MKKMITPAKLKTWLEDYETVNVNLNHELDRHISHIPYCPVEMLGKQRKLCLAAQTKIRAVGLEFNSVINQVYADAQQHLSEKISARDRRDYEEIVAMIAPYLGL